MKYAIVESGGKQFKAVEGGVLEVDRLPAEPGTKIKLDQVLLLVDGENITVGSPIVDATPIWTKVLEHFRGEKVTIFNYSPKKRIRVKTGHRQNYTRLLVEQVGGTEFVQKAVEEKAKTAPAAETAVVEKKVPSSKKSTAPTKAPTKAATKSPAKTVVKTSKPEKVVEKPKPAAVKPSKSGTKKPSAAKKPAAKK